MAAASPFGPEARSPHLMPASSVAEEEPRTIHTVRMRIGESAMMLGKTGLLPIFLETLPGDSILPTFTIRIERPYWCGLGITTTKDCVVPDGQLTLVYDASKGDILLQSHSRLPVSSTGPLCYLRFNCYGDFGIMANVDCVGANFGEGSFALHVRSGWMLVYPQEMRDVVDLLALEARGDSSVLRVVRRCNGEAVADLGLDNFRLEIDAHHVPIRSVTGGAYGSPYELILATPGNLGSDRTVRLFVTDRCGRDTVGTRVLSVNGWSGSIRVLGPTFLCPGDSTVLEAVHGYTRYEWDTGDTGRVVTVRRSGSRSVLATDSTGLYPQLRLATYIGAPSPVTILPIRPLFICPGTTQHLATLRSYRSYRWSTGESSATLLVHQPGEYSVEVVDENGCTLQSPPVSVRALEHLSPRMNAVQKRVICPDSHIELSLTEAFDRYLWSNGDTTRRCKAIAAGTYWVQVWNDGGCTGISDSVTLEATDEALPVITASATLLCVGDSAILTLNNPGIDCRWYGEWGRYLTPVGETTARRIVLRRSETVYVRVVLANGCVVWSDAVRIEFLDFPPKPYIVRHLDTLHTVPADRYQWYLDGEPIAGATRWQYEARVTGSYQVEVFNKAGCGAVSPPFVVASLHYTDNLPVPDFHLDVYPQPAEGWLTVRVGDDVAAPFRFTITDLLGREMLRRDVRTVDGGEAITLDVRALPRGNYLLCVAGTRGRALRVIALW